MGLGNAGGILIESGAVGLLPRLTDRDEWVAPEPISLNRIRAWHSGPRCGE